MFTRFYRDVMVQRCALEQQIIHNALLLASIALDEMAHRITKSPSYIAVTSGEVIHLIKFLLVKYNFDTQTHVIMNFHAATHRHSCFHALTSSLGYASQLQRAPLDHVPNRRNVIQNNKQTNRSSGQRSSPSRNQLENTSIQTV